jgi:hypothetical protein
MLIGMVIGVAMEVAARTLRLWIYHQPQTPMLNVVAMFGVIMGGIASLVPRIGLAPAFVLAVAVGLGYEIANLQLLNWWYFPDERLWFIRGHTAIVVVIALLWGLTPVVIAGAQAALPGARNMAASRQSRLEALAEREKQLLEKLEGLQQRERDIQTRLEELRVLKQALLARQAVHPPGAQTTPVPTP